MRHFRGLLGAGNVWAPICSSRETPVVGDTTTHASDVDCPDCQLVIGAPRQQTQTRIPWDQRPASRELLDRKQRASGDEE